MGGDQLTCERARNSQRHRRDAALAEERLEALEPVVEDWHTEMCLFEVTNIHFSMNNNQIVVVCTYHLDNTFGGKIIIIVNYIIIHSCLGITDM